MNNADTPTWYWALPPGYEATFEGDMGSLTRRECFAALAMQGLLSSRDVFGAPASAPTEAARQTRVAKAAVDYADALLAALEDGH